MAAPGTDQSNEALPPGVEELVATVRARASDSASPAGIRALAAEAAEHARGNIHTIAEIRHLADVALDRAGEIGDLMRQLAELTSPSQEDLWPAAKRRSVIWPPN